LNITIEDKCYETSFEFNFVLRDLRSYSHRGESNFSIFSAGSNGELSILRNQPNHSGIIFNSKMIDAGERKGEKQPR
jgi:hypothetical protein